MTTVTVKVTAKQKVINSILSLKSNTYSQTACDEMSTKELKELLQEMLLEEATPEPELNEDGSLVVHEPTTKVEPPKPTKAAREGGPTKREILYAAFDKAHADGADLKAAAVEASPETSKGVVSSYLCYWRADRGIETTRKFGNTAEKKTNAQKVLALIEKLYGESFDINVVAQEIREAASTKAVDATETANAAE
jgi:hypothetical protein